MGFLLNLNSVHETMDLLMIPVSSERAVSKLSMSNYCLNVPFSCLLLYLAQAIATV
jgi:hypothetical protein